MRSDVQCPTGQYQWSKRYMWAGHKVMVPAKLATLLVGLLGLISNNLRAILHLVYWEKWPNSILGRAIVPKMLGEARKNNGLESAS
jgi:hypothetical protein